MDWFTNNSGWLITLAVLLISGIVWAVRQEALLRQLNGKIDHMDKNHEALETQFTSHEKDANAHVNHLYMRGLEQRIDRLEVSMEKNFERTFAKIDRITDSTLKP